MSSTQSPLVLIGGGSLALEMAFWIAEDAIASRFKITHVVDNREPRREALIRMLGPKVVFVASPDTIPAEARRNAVICVGEPETRQRVWKENRAFFAEWPTIVHSTAMISATASVGDCTVVAPHVYIGPEARVGQNVLLNIRASVGHDAIVGDHSVVSAHCDINGFASCGECSFLGAAAVLTPGAKLGRFSKLSAGSVLTRKTDDGFLLHGNPASGRKMYRVPEADQ